MTQKESKGSDLGMILEKLTSIEERLAKLEAENEDIRVYKKKAIAGKEEDDAVLDGLKINFGGSFETNFGEFGLAWLGNIVLFFAIAFLWQYFNNAGKPLISAIIGYTSVAGIFALSAYFKKSFTYLSFMFNLFGFIILYYITLRLHFYSAVPLIPGATVVVGLLLLLAGFQVYLAVRRKSQVFIGLALLQCIITAYVSGTTHLFFIISVMTVSGVIYLFWKFGWWKIMVISVLLVCLGYLAWLLGNPASESKNTGDLTYYYAFFYFSVTAALYSLVVFKKQESEFPANSIIATILLAGMAYATVLLLLVLMHFQDSFVPFFSTIAVYCIIYSVMLKLWSPWKYSPALYALFGFVAISVAIYGRYHFPDAFLMFTFQSLLVLILALWYRSKIITVMNTLLMLFILLLYYNMSGTLNATNFAIPAVAFASARIINWQKERLNIKTELIRNTYLFILFFSLLYACYKGFPKQYITISWGSIVVVHFLLSIILKSSKYRWMSIATLIITVFYLFMVDLANIDLIYRILAFMVLAVISIVISVYYVKKLKSKEQA